MNLVSSLLININFENEVNEVAEEMQEKIKEGAKSFSDTSYMYISKCGTRKYGKRILY